MCAQRLLLHFRALLLTLASHMATGRARGGRRSSCAAGAREGVETVSAHVLAEYGPQRLGGHSWEPSVIIDGAFSVHLVDISGHLVDN